MILKDSLYVFDHIMLMICCSTVDPAETAMSFLLICLFSISVLGLVLSVWPVGVLLTHILLILCVFVVTDCCLWCWWLIVLLSLVLCILPNWLHRLCCLGNLVSCHWLVLGILLSFRLMLCRSVVFTLSDARTPKYDHFCVKHTF